MSVRLEQCFEPRVDTATRRVYWVDHRRELTLWTDPRGPPLPGGWTERKDDDGVSVFVNEADGFATLSDPRVVDRRDMEASRRTSAAPNRSSAGQHPSVHPSVQRQESGIGGGASEPSRGGLRLIPKENVVVHRDEDWKKDYAVDTKLGQGGFGKILIGRRKDLAQSADPVVIKLLDTKGPKEKRTVAVREVFVHGRVSSHPNVVEFREAYLSKDNVAVVMEYCENNTLHDLMQHRLHEGGQPLPEDHIMFWFAGAADAVAFMHHHGIVHRDIKPANLFLNRNNSIRIGDFGMAVSVDRSKTQNEAGEFHGTPEFLAPEVLEGRPHTQKSDVWALGAVLYNLAALKPPFTVTNPIKQLSLLKDMISTKKYAPLPPVYSKGFRDLVASLLQKKERFRPTLAEVLKSEYLAPYLANLAERQKAELEERRENGGGRVPSFEDFDWEPVDV
jgi:serine/threonine protein kinase